MKKVSPYRLVRVVCLLKKWHGLIVFVAVVFSLFHQRRLVPRLVVPSRCLLVLCPCAVVVYPFRLVPSSRVPASRRASRLICLLVLRCRPRSIVSFLILFFRPVMPSRFISSPPFSLFFCFVDEMGQDGHAMRAKRADDRAGVERWTSSEQHGTAPRTQRQDRHNRRNANERRAGQNGAPYETNEDESKRDARTRRRTA